MDLLSMKLFIHISKTHNFTKTAQEFFMTQPVVSRRMQELENELGFRLFSRGSHGVELTREGEQLAPIFEQSLRQIDQGIFSVKSQIREQTRSVSIAAITPATNMFLPAIIGEFSTLYPDITIEVHRMVPRQICEDLRLGANDIYISCLSDLKIDKNWNCCIVRTDPFGLIVRQSEPCSTPEEARALLENSRVYLIPAEDSPTTTHQSREILAKLGCEHVPQVELRPIESILFNIASGMGVAVLPGKVGPLEAFGLKEVSLEIPDHVDVAAVWKKDAPEEVQLFTDLLTKRI